MAYQVLDAVLFVGCACQEFSLDIGEYSFSLICAVVGSFSTVEPFDLGQFVILIEQVEEPVPEPAGRDKEYNERNIEPPQN